MTIDQATLASPEQRAGRAAVVGGILGFIVVAIAVWMLSIATGLGTVTGIGLGVFVGSWGGLGFGAMLAASISTID